jgi:putative oxidoreductase
MDAKRQGVVSAIGRILLATIFLLSGLHKIADPAGTQQFMSAMGMPAPGFFLVGAIVFELAGALSLILGYWTRVGATLLIVFMIPATLIFHTNFGDQIQFIMFLKNLAMTGGLLYVLAFGPGPLSLDVRLAAARA